MIIFEVIFQRVINALRLFEKSKEKDINRSARKSLHSVQKNVKILQKEISNACCGGSKPDSPIVLRAVEPEDLELLYIWENDRTVWHVSNTLVPFSRYQLKQYIETNPSDIHTHHQLRMMIDCREDKQIRTVGIIDLFEFDPIHQRAGLGILIASAADRRQGYAYQAILQMIEYSRKILFLNQLYCNISASNTASVQLFGKAGFEITGTKKEWLRIENGWEDELLLQLKLG